MYGSQEPGRNIAQRDSSAHVMLHLVPRTEKESIELPQ
jgi:hypothetical protein